ncbi:oxytocin receptor-like isoform X1 [Portunus trituberculatus]|uniref:oxytocin receptor-like isoform X1 n=1 Tax=Portunus trituberculatus TaxID=210409 RepID=UPI001E1CFE0E|nr:oxytocin receptor-like isoform X1 [Portunus trituberculatus]
MEEDGVVVVAAAIGRPEESVVANSSDCGGNSSGNTNGCVTVLGNVTGSERDEVLAQVEVAVLAVLLVVILVSNMLVLVALIRSSLLRPMSRTYFFMTHICTADLMVGLCNVLSQLAWDLTYYFRGPNWLCKSVKFLQVMPLYLSPLLLACLAFDRYRAISWRIGSKLWSSLRMVTMVWALSALLAMPQAFLFSKKQMHNGEFNCWADFPEEWGIKAYVVYFVCAAFFGPMLVTVYCYTCITLKVWRYSRYRRGYVPLRTLLLRWVCCVEREREMAGSRGSTGAGSSVTSGSSSTVRVSRVPLMVHSFANVPQPLSLAKMKTIKLTLVISFFFIVCHAPFCFTQLYRAFATAPPGETSHPIAVITLLLPSLPSCVNPWIYLCFSENLLNQICGCLRGRLRVHHVKENNSIGDQEPEDHHHHHHYSHRRRLRLEQRNRLRCSQSYNRRGVYACRYPSTLSDHFPKSRPKEQIELAMFGTSL